jgi:hypothetical protein
MDTKFLAAGAVHEAYRSANEAIEGERL